MIKSTISLFLTTILVIMIGCSSDYQDETSVQQNPVTNYNVTNGSIALPASQFCFPTGIWGNSSHSQSTIWSGWDPVVGGNWTIGNSYMSAYSNSTAGPTTGTMSLYVSCVPWSTFHGNGSAGYATADGFGINSSNGPGYPTIETGSKILWDTKSICYLSQSSSISDPYEHVWMDTVGNAYGPPNWRVNYDGFPFIAVASQCAWLGRNLGSLTYMTATLGHPVQGPMSTSLGMCLISSITGNLDDGYVSLTQTNGFWGLSLGGGVQEAKAYCFGYN